MVNNIGSTTETLARVIGNTISVTDPLNLNKISMIAGQLDTGAIITDEDGTIGVVVSYTTDANNKLVYTIRTTSVNTEIDIQEILSESY